MGTPSRYPKHTVNVDATGMPEPELSDVPPTFSKRMSRNRGLADHAVRANPVAPQQQSSANEKLYEAYNDLHTLAQDFAKPFDAPAILVTGHQTDGKSALIEALMGFQFNYVGGGTKTRRPCTIHMKYNSTCVQPSCCLVMEDGDQDMSLEELREAIREENQRLEEAQEFWSREIVVKIEYKFCPNLTIIDTPGLISAAPGKKNAVLQTASRQVEDMVLQKMMQKEYIILCLEDTSDWGNATTRRLVMQVDPALSRTVVVSTKFDTRIPQFSTPQDVETFIKPQDHLEAQLLGGSPFFTSVPSGRVGNTKESVFRTNDQFRDAVVEREVKDVTEIETKLQRRLDKFERSRIGVAALRQFLEQLLQRRYLDNVPSIVPLLEKEARNAAARLDRTVAELQDLHPDRLKDKGRIFREAFLTKLTLLLKGTVAATPERFGETLADEHTRGGSFILPDGRALPVPASLPNAHMRLYGGAQFHRAMSEFRLSVGALACPDISREEIVNACGLDDFHDGVNYVRTACVIAVAKAKDMFEPFVHQLGYRLAHVLRRLLPIAMNLLQREGQFLNGHDLFLKRVSGSYHGFLDAVEKSCKAKCLEDLHSTTRYVTWSLHTRSATGLQTMLSKVRAPEVKPTPQVNARDKNAAAASASGPSQQESLMADILQHTLFSRSLGPMSEEIVSALVCQIFEGIRDQLVQTVELKFNCFFLMPVVDTFPARLREEVEILYAKGLDEVFDAGAVRAALEERQSKLQAELHQVERLQHKFATIHSTLAQQESPPLPSSGPKDALRPSLMSLTDSVHIKAINAKMRGLDIESDTDRRTGSPDTRPTIAKLTSHPVSGSIMATAM